MNCRANFCVGSSATAQVTAWCQFMIKSFTFVAICIVTILLCSGVGPQGNRSDRPSDSLSNADWNLTSCLPVVVLTHVALPLHYHATVLVPNAAESTIPVCCCTPATSPQEHPALSLSTFSTFSQHFLSALLECCTVTACPSMLSSYCY